MNIIPVIDLLGHEVVHAKRGERQHYRPIASTLCHGSQPLTITQALLELYPFDTLYIADLNAIQGRPAHVDEVAEIRGRYPDLHIWLDAGFSQPDDLLPWTGLRITPVIGSESLRDIEAYSAIAEASGEHVLSLDFRGDHYQGPAPLLSSPQRWPTHVICMTLAQVGSNSGPDHQRLQQISSLARPGTTYAAGGIRNNADLQRLQQEGIAGALVASALHAGQIKADDIRLAI